MPAHSKSTIQELFAIGGFRYLCDKTFARWQAAGTMGRFVTKVMQADLLLITYPALPPTVQVLAW